MSPDRTTLTRAEAIRRRKEEEDKRREKATPKTVARLKPVATPKPKLKPISQAKSGSKPKVAHPLPKATPSRLRSRYDLAMSAPYGRENYQMPQAPSITLPKVEFGPRWISFLFLVLCVSGLYALLGQEMFLARGAQIVGNQRVSAEQIAGVLGIQNQPVALLNPAQIEYNILAAYPDLSAAQVEISLPAEVMVRVTERQPLVAWQQDGKVNWVDGAGYAFPPRGELAGLVTVSAAGAPPTPSNLDLAQTIGARPFLTPGLLEMVIGLAPNLPQGATLVFDPNYGLGWSDPRGWKVYFGHSDGDAQLKLQVYQALVAYLTERNLQPALISVEYPNAPFYRMEQ
jgi:cell division protein FtsQ